MVEPNSRQLLHEVREATMTHAERKAMRDKHHLYYEEDLVECVACSTPEDSVEWPCDVIKVLDYLDVVDPMPTEINWQGGK